MSESTHHDAGAHYLRFPQRYIDQQRQLQSDVEIRCEGTRFRAHSKIIALHAPEFRKMCKPSFDRLGHLEICLDDEPVLAVKAMVDNLYTLQPRFASDFSQLVTARKPNGTVVDPPALVQVSLLAARFAMARLEHLAIDGFKTRVSSLPLAFLAGRFFSGNQPRKQNPMAAVLDRVLEAVYGRGPFRRSSVLRSIVVDSMLTDKMGQFSIPPDSPATDPAVVAAAKQDFVRQLRAMPELRSDLVAAKSSRSGRKAADMTPDHLCCSMLLGRVELGRSTLRRERPVEAVLGR